MKKVKPSDWRGHFMLADEMPSLDGAEVCSLRTLHLAAYAPLRVVQVKDQDHADLGVLLGDPLDVEHQKVVRDVFLIPRKAPLDVSDVDAFVEEEIYRLSGKFIFILDISCARRVYLDAGGMLGAVYSKADRRVAATSVQLMDCHNLEQGFREESFNNLCVLRDGWFPGDLTAHTSVKRLLPDFYLDLDTYETRRHWPSAPVPQTDNPQKVCADIVSCVRDTIALLAADRPVNIALTGGNETRMLVAASRGILNKVDFITVSSDDSAFDASQAALLAKKFHLKHRFIRPLKASEAQAEDHFARTGYARGGPHLFGHTTSKLLTEPGGCLLGGLGGEVGRGFFWRKDDNDQTPVDAASLYARLGLPPDPEALSAVQQWLETAKHLPTLLLLDLAYLELRVASWCFALSYTSLHRYELQPLVSRKIFSLMLSLPPEWRRKQGQSTRAIVEYLRQAWPQLLEVSIGCYGDYRDKLLLLKKALKEPHLIVKKLRKLYG